MIALLFYQLPTGELLHIANIILTIVFWGFFYLKYLVMFVFTFSDTIKLINKCVCVLHHF